MRNFFRFKSIFVLLILIVSLLYVCNIDNLPNKVIIFEGEALSLKTLLGVNVETKFSSNPNIERLENNKTVTVSANVDNYENVDCTGTVDLDVKFLSFKVKRVNVEIIEDTKVIPMGNLIGVKLYTDGVLVVGMSEISGIDKKQYKPYKDTGIEEGDVIIKIDENDITSTNELLNQINKSAGNDMNVKYVRNRRSIRNYYKCNKIKR